MPPRLTSNTAIADVLHTGSVSIAGLASIIRKLKVDDRIESVLRGVIGDVNHEHLQRLGHVIRVPLANGRDFDLDIIDPCKFVRGLVATSPATAAVYSEAARRHPPSPARPWHLVIGFDEFTPGNKNRFDQSRKTMVVSVTFRELGQTSMSDELFWHTIVVVRSNVLKEIVGGFSCVLRHILEHIMTATIGLATSGVQLDLEHGSTLLFASISNILSDGDGLRMAFDWKGASGIKPCIKHMNVFKKDIHPRVTWASHVR